jgi:D-alanyl-D-alanine dipeptidase
MTQSKGDDRSVGDLLDWQFQTIMEQHGFEGLPTEWWHFDFQGWGRFPISDRPID